MKNLFVCLLCLLPLLLSVPLFAQEQPTILITEVFYNAPGRESDEEWLEIANLGSTDLDLSGYKIGDEEDEGGLEGMSQFPDGAILPAGAVAIIAQNSAGFVALFGQRQRPGRPRYAPLSRLGHRQHGPQQRRR